MDNPDRSAICLNQFEKNLPLQKAVGKTFSVNLVATFDLTRYKPDNKSALDNTFWYISPSILFKTPKINAQAGIRPSWDNKTFKMFPNMLIEASTEDQRFTFQAGWSGLSEEHHISI